MSDFLRRLFGRAPADDDLTAQKPVTRRPAVARRKASPRRPGSASARPRAASGLSLGTPPPDIGAEIPCPSCGEPMLPGWGTTCGKCRPAMVAPKTMFGADGAAIAAAVLAARVGSQGMVLGWLVVLQSVDTPRTGLLLDLDTDEVVLSRSGVDAGLAGRVVQLDDEFMSMGHAILRRPRTGAKTEAFTLRDRSDPAPSTNGTFVNSHKLGPREEMALGDGDIIKVGATRLLFKSLWLPGPGAGARTS